MNKYDKIVRLVRYEPTTGKLYWTQQTHYKNDNSGKEAGYLRKDGYRVFQYKNVSYRVHNVVWYIHTGEWPSKPVRHIDGNRDNNRFENLTLDQYRVIKTQQQLRSTRVQSLINKFATQRWI